MKQYSELQSGIVIPYEVNTKESYRADAWTNAESGQGMPGIDKTLSTTFSPYNTVLNYQVLTSLYKTDWLSRKLCMRPAKDATRKFIQFKDVAKTEPVSDKFKDIGVRQKVKTAIAWSRLFGGAGIVLITKDADPESPLESKPDNLVDIEVYDRWDLTPVAYDTDYNSTNYMKPLIFQTYEGKRFHHTRVCKFMGAELTRREWIEELYWGGSIVTSVYSAIKHLQATYDDVRHILTELNIGILKVPNLTATNVQGGAQAAVQRRVNKFNLTKSNYRVAAIDSEEDFQFINRSVAGVTDLMNQFKTAVGAASEMGELVLFGESPAGFGGSQEEQLSIYYDMIEDIRQDQIAPCIETLLYADGYEEAEWSFESLWEMSDKDKAMVMQQSAAAIAPLINVLLTPEDAINQLNSLGVWNIDSQESDLGIKFE